MGEAKGVRRWLPSLALALAVTAAYAPSLRGGFLNYDDGWLIQNNPILRRADVGALAAVWTDLRPDTRHVLGAEYLPVRDTLMWLELRLFGPSAPPMRAVSLAVYLTALLLLGAYLRATFADDAADPPPWTLATVALWLFALHPVHVESVAWLAGQKDLCALALAAAALAIHARGRRPWAVPLLVLLAALAKGVAVAVPLLLLAHDWFVRRRPRWAVLAASLAAALAVMLVHVAVGRRVGMLAQWPGGGRLATAATMGPVWLRYLGESFVPVGLSVRHEVAAHGAADARAWAAYLPLALAAALAVAAARRGWRLPAFALAWFVVPLLPTSQVLAPLQNLMADRYLLLAVLGPCLVVAFALRALRRRLPSPWPSAAVVAVMGVLTAWRAPVFASSVALWSDAVVHEPDSAHAQYQLAMALREAGRRDEAEAALRRAAAADDEVGRRAANNLAALLTDAGRLPEAQAVLRETAARYPDDPKALGNLAEITARLGQTDEARRLFEQLRRRFPRYQPGLRNYRLHFPDAAGGGG